MVLKDLRVQRGLKVCKALLVHKVFRERQVLELRDLLGRKVHKV